MNIPKVAVWYYRINDTDELKYSIRSAVKNLGIEKVFLVGDCPKWFKESENSVFIKSEPRRDLGYSIAYVPWQHMESFVNSGLYSGEFLLFNDDFFVLKPIDEWIDYYRDIDDYDKKCGIHNRVYHRRELRAFNLLKIPFNSGRHYNLHMPMRMNTKNVKIALDFWKKQLNKDFEFRTTYGNMFKREDYPHRDVKYDSDGEFLSGSDKLWYEDEIRKLFPEKSFCEV